MKKKPTTAPLMVITSSICTPPKLNAKHTLTNTTVYITYYFDIANLPVILRSHMLRNRLLVYAILTCSPSGTQGMRSTNGRGR
jgi:hypothetical protein